MTNANILIVEGKKADRPSFASQLQKKGFIVTVSANGSEALGRLIEIGPAPQFFESPADPRTAAFVRGEMVY